MILKQKLVLLFGAIICISKVTDVFSAATEEQMWATCKLIRDVCQPKFPKVSQEVADGIKEGNLPNEKDAKCYVNCIMEMMQTMKKGKFMYDGSLKQVDLIMPDKFKESYRIGLTNCKDAATGIKNSCDASYELFICLRKEISTFIFP